MGSDPRQRRSIPIDRRLCAGFRRQRIAVQERREVTGPFIARLRTGIPSGEMGPWLPRETIPIYAITLIGSIAVILTFTLTSFTLATSVPIQLATVAMLLIVS